MMYYLVCTYLYALIMSPILWTIFEIFVICCPKWCGFVQNGAAHAQILAQGKIRSCLPWDLGRLIASN